MLWSTINSILTYNFLKAASIQASQVLGYLWGHHEVFYIFKHNVLIGVFRILQVIVNQVNSPVGSVERVVHPITVPQTFVPSLDSVGDEWVDS